MLQTDALRAAGCSRLFAETASGALSERPRPKAVIDYLRPGDTLVVWKLDRLARSIKQLIETIEILHNMGCGFRSLTEATETTTPSGKLVFHIFGALTEFGCSVHRAEGEFAYEARGPFEVHLMICRG